jgi:mono/diheme cytochrome c family protein
MRFVLAAVLLLAPASVARTADQATVALYKARCQVCHGVNGRSSDRDRNLADGRWIHGRALADVIRVIEEGVPGKAMVSFRDQLSKRQIAALARYVRTFAAQAAAAGKATARQ